MSKETGKQGTKRDRQSGKQEAEQAGRLASRKPSARPDWQAGNGVGRQIGKQKVERTAEPLRQVTPTSPTRRDAVLDQKVANSRNDKELSGSGAEVLLDRKERDRGGRKRKRKTAFKRKEERWKTAFRGREKGRDNDIQKEGKKEGSFEKEV